MHFHALMLESLCEHSTGLHLGGLSLSKTIQNGSFDISCLGQFTICKASQVCFMWAQDTLSMLELRT